MAPSGEQGGGGGEEQPQLEQVPHLLLPHPGKAEEEGGREIKRGKEGKGGPLFGGIKCMSPRELCTGCF